MSVRRIIVSVILSLSFALGTLSPALALAGTDALLNNVTSAVKETTDAVTADTTNAAKKEIEDRGHTKAEDAREKAKDRLSALKATIQERTTEVRISVCEKRKATIVGHLQSLADIGKKHKETFDAIVTRADEFVATNNLVVIDGAALRANIETTKSDVATEVSALVDLKGSVDCNDPDSVAAGLDAFKSQAAVVRDSLNSYRAAIKTYLQAVKTAAESAKVDGGKQ